MDPETYEQMAVDRWGSRAGLFLSGEAGLVALLPNPQRASLLHPAPTSPSALPQPRPALPFPHREVFGEAADFLKEGLDLTLNFHGDDAVTGEVPGQVRGNPSSGKQTHRQGSETH